MKRFPLVFSLFFCVLSISAQDTSLVVAQKVAEVVKQSTSWTDFFQNILVATIPFVIGLFIKRPSVKKKKA